MQSIREKIARAIKEVDTEHLLWQEYIPHADAALQVLAECDWHGRAFDYDVPFIDLVDAHTVSIDGDEIEKIAKQMIQSIQNEGE